MISFWSYKREYKKFNKKILSRLDKVLLKGNIFFGSELEKFEKNFTPLCGEIAKMRILKNF